MTQDCKPIEEIRPTPEGMEEVVRHAEYVVSQLPPWVIPEWVTPKEEKTK